MLIEEYTRTCMKTDENVAKESVQLIGLPKKTSVIANAD